MDTVVPLSHLQTGQAAFVEQIVGHVDDVHRLHEFGLRDGTQIQMFRPGNPCIIRMAGNKICLRADQLLNVLVRPLPAGG